MLQKIQLRKHLLFPLLVCGIYLVTFLALDKLAGLSETFPNVHSWYPPAGLSFALVLAVGPCYAVLVAVATVIADLWIRPMPVSFWDVLLFASSTAIIYSAAAWLLGRVSGELKNDLRTSRAFGRFLLGAVLTAVAVASVNGLNLLMCGLIEGKDFCQAVLDGSIGTAVGILCVTPFLLLKVLPLVTPWLHRVGGEKALESGFGRILGSAHPKPWLIGGGVFFGLSVLWILFGLGIEDRFLIFWLLCLPLIWLSLVEGLESVSLASLGLSFGAVGVLLSVNPGIGAMTELQTLVLTSSLIGMLIGSAVTESRLLARASSYRDAVLACVSVAVEKLVAQDDWKQGLTEILQMLGNASQVSHIYLVENHHLESTDVLDVIPLHWVSPKWAIHEHQLRMLNLLRVHQLSQEIDALSQGKVLHYRKEYLPEEDRVVLSALGLRATVVLPIIVGQRLWGCLGLDRSMRQGDWVESEIDALKATARGLGTVLAQARTEGQVRELAGNIRAVFWTSGPKGQRRSYVSPAYEQIWGRNLTELRESPEDWKEAIHFEDISAVESGVMKNGEFDLEYRIVLPDRSIRWIRDRGFPVRNEDGEISKVVGIAEDITVQKRAEERIRSTTLLLTTLIDNLGSGILVEDEQRCVRHVNQAFCELFDVPAPKERLLGTDSRLLVSRSRSFASRIEEIRQKRKALIGEELEMGNLTLRRDFVPLSLNAQDHFHLWQYQDITEAKRAEQQIKDSLNEKEVLLQEIHHRVKNNLQIICSLLSLQSNKIRDEEVLQIFTDSQNRVKAMALVHERLYQSQDFGRVDFPGYTRNLTDHLIRSYRADPSTISLNVDVESVPMDIITAVPCGLIINELVSNALKYAFPGNREGQILVRLYQEGTSHLHLVVKDDGIGLPVELDLGRAQSLGLKLVNGLTQQIGGTACLKNKNGTEFDIQFPPNGQTFQKGSGNGEITHLNC